MSRNSRPTLYIIETEDGIVVELRGGVGGSSNRRARVAVAGPVDKTAMQAAIEKALSQAGVERGRPGQMKAVLP